MSLLNQQTNTNAFNFFEISATAKKGSSRPLIDTGTMRNSIRYEVENV